MRSEVIEEAGDDSQVSELSWEWEAYGTGLSQDYGCLDSWRVPFSHPLYACYLLISYTSLHRSLLDKLIGKNLTSLNKPIGPVLLDFISVISIEGMMSLGNRGGSIQENKPHPLNRLRESYNGRQQDEFPQGPVQC